MRIFIGIVTHDRPDLLELLFRYMHLEAPQAAWSNTELYVFDTGSLAVDREPTVSVLRAVSEDIRSIEYTRVPVSDFAPSVDNCNAELGFARATAIETFMSHKEFTHCVLLDDDILVDLETICKAAADCQLFADMGVASVTLHPFPKRFGDWRYRLGDVTYVNHDFSGDCGWVIPRATIKRFGNLFGPEPGGYANNLWAQIKNEGLTSITRLSPCYEVQHLGVENLFGSIIYRGAADKPKWTRQLFLDYLTKRTLHSEVAMLLSSGKLQNLLDYTRKETRMIHRIEEQDTGDARNLVRKEHAPMPRGKLEIEVEDTTTGKKRLVLVDNLVVDNAKEIMARLLGSALAADWALQKMIFGTGSTTPTEGDVSLEIPITPEKAVTVDYPDDTSVRFTATLESDEANGFSIAEAALYSGSEGIFSRVVFGPLSKTSDFRFVFRWTVYW